MCHSTDFTGALINFALGRACREGYGCQPFCTVAVLYPLLELFLYQGLLQHIGMLGIFLTNPSTLLLSFFGVPHGVCRQRNATVPSHHNYHSGTDCVMLNIGCMSRSSVPKKVEGDELLTISFLN